MAAWGRALARLHRDRAFPVHERVDRASRRRGVPRRVVRREGRDLTHPDGRVQRLPRAIGRPPAVRAAGRCWPRSRRGSACLDAPSRTGVLLAEIAEGRSLPRFDDRRDRRRGRALARARGLPRGDARAAAASRASARPREPPAAPAPPTARCGSARCPTSGRPGRRERSPALDFLRPEQELQLHPSDAERLGSPRTKTSRWRRTDTVRGRRCACARARVRAPRISCAGTAEENANLLDTGDPLFVHVKRVETEEQERALMPLADTQFVETTGV